jgi:DNA polymerase-1
MRMLVTDLNLDKVIEDLRTATYIGFDTETYGLILFDDFFCLQFATTNGSYYFNCKKDNGLFYFDRFDVINKLSSVFDREDVTWFIHNAKFDMHRIANYDNRRLNGIVHCTQAIERIIYNQHLQYGLDACLKRRGRAKNNKVEAEIKEHKLYSMVKTEAKKTKVKMKYYDKVDSVIMFEYGCQDAEDVLFLGMDQLSKLQKMGSDYTQVYATETALTKAAFEVEREGVRINIRYAIEGKKYEESCYRQEIKNIEEISGRPYKSGPKWLSDVLDNQGIEYPINKQTGNPIFDKKSLELIGSPVTESIIKARTHEKFASTYYGAFLEKNINGRIYATINQAGTDTGRFSYSEPNLQNVPKEEGVTEGFQVRKVFEPDTDYCFVMIDYDQQEFRLMLDYAGERDLIRNIMDNGLDIHQATADMVGIARKPAKSLNFGLLYGMGEGKLAVTLGLPTYIEYFKDKPVVRSMEARQLMNLYFSKLPRVQMLVDNIQGTAKSRGYIRTWTGRHLHFPNYEMAYKAPNHLIQGGCGDIAKIAMIRLVDKLADMRSKVLLQVHDEFIFKVHKDEFDIVPELKSIMENVYTPKNGMYLTCGIEHSWKSWGKQDVISGPPTRSDIQGQSNS